MAGRMEIVIFYHYKALYAVKNNYKTANIVQHAAKMFLR